jgi:8-oxo-dGTP pyrophosphatase MutT (NUDIX family)
MKRRGAGVVVLSASTGRVLFALRSPRVSEPCTWSGWGGGVEPGETLAEAALREFVEETGYQGPVRLPLAPLYTFDNGTFTYQNFLLVVPEEFRPRINDESADAIWLPLDEAPHPQHYGLELVLGDPDSRATIARALVRRRKNPVVPGPLYHITFLGRLASIAEEGLVRGAGDTFQSYAGYARGWIFLTDEDALRGWFHKLHAIAESESDNPLEDGWIPVVLRVQQDVDAEEDPEGSRDVPEGASYRTREAIEPDALEVWNGHDWVPLDEWESIDPELGVTHELDDGEDLVWLDDADSSGLFPLWREDWGPRRGRFLS